METAYSLDDVLLEPKFSGIPSRLHTILGTKLSTHTNLDVPLVSTNMSTITEYDMMKVMDNIGGAGILHRFMKPHQSIDIVSKACDAGLHPLVVSIGVGDHEFERAKTLLKYGANVVLIDVAHGHSQQVIDQVKQLQGYKTHKQFDVIVGNIATYDAAMNFLRLGVNGLRVGIGGGSRCTTRTVTGHGVPNLTALMNVVKARDEYVVKNSYVPVIIDGGIKNSGDIVKALYFGADVACLGNLLAGTTETPGEVITKDDSNFKKFYGMASKEAQDTHRNGLKNGTSAEGFSELVPYKGSVVPILEQLIGGVRSGLTYSGVNNIPDLRTHGTAYLLSNGARHESKL